MLRLLEGYSTVRETEICCEGYTVREIERVTESEIRVCCEGYTLHSQGGRERY